MSLIQILLVVLIVYLITSILILFAIPTTKKTIDLTADKSFEIYGLKEKQSKLSYFGIHYFDSGWSEAKKSPQQFIRFMILSPLIFVAWLLWLFFGRDLPPDFVRKFPHNNGGRPKQTWAYKTDDDAVKMILQDNKSFDETFEALRPKYYSQEQWDALNDDYEKEQAFKTWKRRIERRIKNDQ